MKRGVRTAGRSEIIQWRLNWPHYDVEIMFFKDLIDALIAAEFGQMGNIRGTIFRCHISLFAELKDILVIVSWELLLAAIKSNRGITCLSVTLRKLFIGMRLVESNQLAQRLDPRGIKEFDIILKLLFKALFYFTSALVTCT